MASSAFYPGNGVLTDFTVPCPYIDKNDIHLTVDGVAASFTWVNDALIRATVAPANGSTVRVYRSTPVSSPLVSFQDGAALTERELRDSSLQVLYATEEGRTAVDELGLRALRIPAGETTIVLPAASERAGKLLGFDHLGNVTSLVAGDTSSTDVTATGGTSAASLAARFGRMLNVVDDFGVGVGNDLAGPLNAAVARLSALGGGTVFIPQGEFALSATVVVRSQNIKIIGAGRGSFHNAPPYWSPGAANITWTGANGGTMFDFGTATGGAQRVQGCELSGVALIAGVFPFTNAAAVGVRWASVAHGKIDVTTFEFSTAHVLMTGVTGLPAGESAINEANDISIRFRALSNAGTILSMQGIDGVTNSAMNHFPYIGGVYHHGDVVDLAAADNNRFTYIAAYKASGGAGKALIFRGQRSLPLGEYARANIIDWFSGQTSGPVIVVEGTDTTGVVVASRNNQIIFFDTENDTPNIQIGSGGAFWYGTDHAPIGMLGTNIGPDLVAGFGFTRLVNGQVDFWGRVSVTGGVTATVNIIAALGIPSLINGVQNVTATAQGTTGGANVAVAGFSSTGFTVSCDVSTTINYRGVAF